MKFLLYAVYVIRSSEPPKPPQPTFSLPLVFAVHLNLSPAAHLCLYKYCICADTLKGTPG
jgi:hypothetical protein